MKYQELIRKYPDSSNIPYEELLKTDEWNEKREKILQRDNFQCQNCNKIKSEYIQDTNVSVNMNNHLIKDSIYYMEQSLKSYKNNNQITEINFYQLKNYQNRLFGIADNNQIFLMDNKMLDEIKDSKNKAIINYGFSNTGIKYLIIGLHNKRYINPEFTIPEITTQSIVLHVHHQYYIFGNLPWEYDEKSLKTLCNLCHWEFHEKHQVPVWKILGNDLEKLTYTVCHRCYGAGIFHGYNHIQNGICFRCSGRKYEELINL